MEENKTPGTEVKNPAHLLTKKLQENRKSLFIQRVPTATKETFKKLADDEFCGDYGMALKWLIDDIPGQDIRMVLARFEEHEVRLQALESKVHGEEIIPVESNKRIIKKLDRSVVEVKE